MNIQKKLRELGHGSVGKSFYTMISVWESWYQGCVKDFHNYTVNNGIELLECQRYYVNFGDMTFRASLSERSEDGAEAYSVSIPFPVPMRAVPGSYGAVVREGQLSDAVNVSRYGLSYSSLTGKYTLRNVYASADLL